MTTKLGFSLPQDHFNPLDRSAAEPFIENSGPERIHVSKVRIRFDWGDAYYEDANVEIGPGKGSHLPPVLFLIGLKATEGSHHCEMGVTLKELSKDGDWSKPQDVWYKLGKHLFVSPSPKRRFSVFVSHSNDSADSKLLNVTLGALRLAGFDPVVAESKPRPGYPLWRKIRGLIAQSNGVIVLWTKAGSGSGDVREEIGIGIGVGLEETMIPLLASDTQPHGFIGGLEYCEFDPTDFDTFYKALEDAIGELIGAAKKRPEAGQAPPASNPK